MKINTALFLTSIAKLEKNMAAKPERQAAEIEKVHTRIEIKKSSPQLAAKNR